MKRKFVAAALAASLTVSAAVPVHAQERIVLPPPHGGSSGPGAGPWIVGGIVCAALGPILTTLIVNRHLTRDEAVASMFFCFPPGLYGALLQSQSKGKKKS